MSNHFSTCGACPVRGMCKIYNGEVPPLAEDVCSALYRYTTAYNKSNIPPLYSHKFRKDFISAKDNVQVLPSLEGVLSNLDDLPPTIMVQGASVGAGKTFIASIILSTIMLKKCVASYDMEFPLVFFETYSDLMNDLRYNRDRAIPRLAFLQQVPYLLVDDVGVGTFSDFTREQFYNLVNQRVNKGLTTLYTTNLNSIQLIEALGNRTVSRMAGGAVVINVEGQDKRGGF